MALDGAIVLITGGCGQVGVAITRQIRRQYPACKLHVLDLTTPASSAPQFVESVVYHEGNVTDVSAVRTVFTAVKPEVVFHTAGLIPQIAMRLGINQEHNYMQVNVEGTRNLLEEAKALGSRVRAFIYTSSADIAKGNSWDNLVNVNEQMEMPARFDNAYAKSKAAAESLVTGFSTPQLPTTSIRTHAVFGANDNNLIPLMLSAPRNIHFGPGTNLYDFTYGPNLADAHILAAVNLLTVSPADKSNLLSAAGKAFFVTNAEPMPFRDFLSQLWTTFDGKKPPKGVSIPTAVALPLVWLMEHVSKAVGKTPALTTKDLGDSLAERWFDNSRAAEVFGYVPKVKIADGLKEAAKDYEELKNGYEISLRDASRPISNT